MRLGQGRRWGLVLLAALVVLGLGLVRVALWRPLEVVGADPGDGYARVAGVVHVHTTLSDGGGTPEEVIQAAKATGLAFVGITDHNNLDAKPFEGYRDGVLVLVGAELSTPAGHLVGLGLDRDPAWRFNGDGLDALEDVRDLGGVPFAAHPFSARTDLRWNGWELPGPWGIELLNGDSDARRAGPRVLLSVGLYRVNPGYALLQGLRPPDEALRRWDEMLARRDVVGLAGSDAHSRLALTKTRALRFPSYESLFAQARNHVLLDRPLTGDAAADRVALLDAFRRGRFYLGLDALAPADGFRFTIEGEPGERWTMGDHVPRSGRARRRRRPRAAGHARRPPAGRKSGGGGGGVARGRPSRPRRLPRRGPPAGLARALGHHEPRLRPRRSRRARPVAWPPPGPPRRLPPREVRALASLDGSAAFNPEFDPSSRVDAGVVAPGAGPEGTDALMLAFRLGAPTRHSPSRGARS